MAEISPLKQSSFDGILGKCGSSMGFESMEGGNITTHTYLYGTEDRGESKDFHSSFSDLGFCEDRTADEEHPSSKYQREQEVKLFSVFGSSDDLYRDVVSPPFQLCQEEISKLAIVKSENSELIEPLKEEEKPYTIPLASLTILKNYRSRFKELKGEKINLPSHDTPYNKVSGQKLSTDAVIRLAAESFIQSCSQGVDDLSILSHPFVSSFLGLSTKENKDVELVMYLLASAGKVGKQQFDRANKLLDQCDELSSSEGNSVQRLVYYFSVALRDKIGRETGIIASKGLGKKELVEFEEAVMSPSPTNIAFHQQVPFYQVSQYTGMQVIIDNVAEAKKIHIIDLVLMKGAHCVVLMQALAARSECPLEHLKITAIGTKSKKNIKKTGERLMSFAQSMNLSFSFNIVMVKDMLDLNEDRFELDDEETIAVHSSYLLSTMISRADRLECLMRVIKNINPRVMVVTEVEANHNSPVFVNRFIEALFFYGSVFDSLEDCMDHGNPNRTKSELEFYSGAIENIVAAEGEERTVRQVNISVWRKFFVRFGMMEQQLSMSSLYQASLVVKNFARWSSCTLSMDGKSLIIGWKGTPVQSLSAWKFL